MGWPVVAVTAMPSLMTRRRVLFGYDFGKRFFLPVVLIAAVRGVDREI
jgi:hypothetical protein